MTTIPKNHYNGDGRPNEQPKEVPTDALPMTETVLNIPQMIPQDHIWLQQGRVIIDYCEHCPASAVPIPAGMTLIKDDKGYALVSDQEAVKRNTR